MTDHDYIRQLAAHLARATEFRIPCPGHPFGKVVDLLVRRRPDTHGDGFGIFNNDGEAWTGTSWRSITSLALSEIYRYTRDEALTEAERIAPDRTQAYLKIRAQLYGQHETSTTPGYDAALAAAEALGHQKENRAHGH
jgi:hypothetical protein